MSIFDPSLFFLSSICCEFNLIPKLSFVSCVNCVNCVDCVNCGGCVNCVDCGGYEAWSDCCD